MLQEWLDWCAAELERLRAKVKQGDAGPEVNAAISRLERVFVEREDDDDELGDPWEGGDIDPDRGYLTGDPTVDRWEREFARTGKLPEDF